MSSNADRPVRHGRLVKARGRATRADTIGQHPRAHEAPNGGRRQTPRSPAAGDARPSEGVPRGPPGQADPVGPARVGECAVPAAADALPPRRRDKGAHVLAPAPPEHAGLPARRGLLGLRRAARSHPGAALARRLLPHGGEIARLLQLIGRGTSLRRSSQTVRLEAQKFVEDEGLGGEHVDVPDETTRLAVGCGRGARRSE